jgi:5-methylcytosine-specific restriction endonuclease McrA
MPPPNWKLVGIRLYWAYANLAMAHAAVTAGDAVYGRKHYMIRSRLFSGLCTGKMQVSGFLDDDRLKLQMPRACCYCAAEGPLTLDHLLPRALGGLDESDNIVWACAPCNGSKGKSDLLAWTSRKGVPPSLLLFRRYLKLAVAWCTEHDLLGAELDAIPQGTIPFALDLLPMKMLPPSDLRLWVTDLSTS